MNAIRRSVSILLATTLLSGATLIGPACVFAQSAFVPMTEKTNTIVSGRDLAPVTLFDYRDPNSQELIRFQYQPSTPAELKKFSPKKARLEMQGMGPAPLGFKGAAKKLVVDFPAEYLAFTLAMGISESLHLENNPVFLRDFVDNNASVVGGVSFAGFLVGARSSHAFLQMLGLAYDPRRTKLHLSLQPGYVTGATGEVTLVDNKGRLFNQTIQEPIRKDHFQTRPVLSPSPPNMVQRGFAPLVGPVGLAAGMMVSNIIHEILADPNLKACAKASIVGAPKHKDVETQKVMQAKIDEACEHAWEDWAVSKKAADYTPDILSMASASLIQAYFANPLIRGTYKLAGKGAKAVSALNGIQLGNDAASGALRATAVRVGREKYVPVILKGARVMTGVTGAHPLGRFVMTVGNITLFMEILHYQNLWIPFKEPFERSRQGRAITDRINSVFIELERAEKNKWVWEPRPASDFCTGYEMDPMGSVMMPNMNCVEPEQFDPAFLLKKVAERQAKWREFVLQDAYLAHKNWQSYVADYATMYGNAAAFYQQIVQLVNYQRYHPRAKLRPATLYVPEPFYGLYTDPENRDAESARAAIQQAREWLETYLEGMRLRDRTGKSINRTEREVLPQILNGLRAIDKEVPITSLGAIELSFRSLSGMTEPQRQDLERRIRERLLSEAIAKLRKVLSEDVAYNDKFVPLDSPMYKRMAETNPFMALRLRLGNPEPMAAGLAFIRESNGDKTVIEQETKGNHPGAIGNVRTDTMADYLIASMVCGPEADPRYSDEEKVKIYKDRKMSFYERTLLQLGLGRRTISANDPAVLIAVQEHIDETTRTAKSMHPNPQSGATSHEWAGFSADFRPPRIVEGIPASLCDGKFAARSDLQKDRALFDGNAVKWTVNGVQYDSLLDIVRKKVRTDLVGTALPPDDKDWVHPFQTWWSSKVDKHTEAMIVKFRASFRSILKDKYIPALTRTGSDATVKYNNRDFKLGALESLYDEVDLYLKVVAKISGISTSHPNHKLFNDLSAGVLLEFKNVGSLVTDLELVEAKGEVARAQFDIKRKALQLKLEDLKKLVDETQTAGKVAADGTKIKDQAFKNLNGLMGEMDAYWGVIRSIQVSPAM